MRDKKVEINRRGWKEEIRKEIILARTRKLREREKEKEKEREKIRYSGECWHAGTTSPVPGSFRQHFRLSCGSTIGAGSKHDADRVRSTERAR